jgi:hypothetical protein
MIKLGDLCGYIVVLFASEAVVQGVLGSNNITHFVYRSHTENQQQ